VAEDVLMANSESNDLVDTIEAFYTAKTSSNSGKGAKITAFTASNDDSPNGSATYKAYIYDASGSVLRAVVPQKIIVPDRFDLAPSIIGQLIPPGGSLRMETSRANAITFRVTGKEL